jgi:hypothetical protein
MSNFIPVEEYIPQPAPETKLWRYMDFAKFMSMVHTSALFFSQVKRLEDTYEGSTQWLGDVKTGTDMERELIAFYNNPKGLRAYSAVSCWHMNEYESAAMWKLYLTNNQGIAVQTTVEKLRESITIKWDKAILIRGAVIYGKIPLPPPGKGIGGEIALFWKRESFAHEKEYRVALFGTNQLSQMNLAGGLTVDANLDTLIERIYVAPSAPQWIKPLIESILKRKYNLDKPVIQSDLDRKALW